MILARLQKINREIDTGLIAVTCIAIILFLLSILRLNGSFIPSCDEGLFASAGVLISKGYIPYLDFPLPHFPMLAILIGIPLKITGSMYWVHILYLLSYFLSSIFLYQIFQRLHQNQWAGIIAILLYLTCSGSVLDITRCISMRTVGSIFLIGFISVGLMTKESMAKNIVFFCIATISVLTFEPTGLVLAGVSCLLILRTKKEERIPIIEKHLVMYLSLSVVIGGLLLHPDIYAAIIESWHDRIRLTLAYRIHLLTKDSNIFFFCVAIAGLFWEILRGKTCRMEAVGAIGLIILSVWLPPSFYPHYISAALPAFAFGVFLLLSHIWQFHIGYIKAPFIGILLSVSIITMHGLSAWPSLYRLWFKYEEINGIVDTKEFSEVIDVLKRSPEPLLTLSPIYAAESGMTITKKPMHIFFRMPTYTPLTPDEFQQLDAEACTIFLHESLRKKLSTKTIERYFHDYEIVWQSSPEGSAKVIFWTHHDFCSTSRY